MRILVSGWTGSTNLGDELVFTGIRALLTRQVPPDEQPRIAAVSIDPSATRADHDVSTIDHRRLDRIAAAARSADLVVFGGGGLIQDETSPWNLPYHLSRPLFAALGRTPWVALDLGVGPLEARGARRLATGLRHAAAVTVRDEPSQALLAEIGVGASLAADAAFHLPVPRAKVEGSVRLPTTDAGSLVVSLRPWRGTPIGGERWLPVGWRSGPGEPDWFVTTIAGALDRAVHRTGLSVRFVALQTDRDAQLHERVAAAMDSHTSLVVPTRHTVLGELARARVVVAMRYHAGIGATLAGRPSVLIGYSPKVDALAATLGDGAAHRPFSREAIAGLDEAIVAQVESMTAVDAVTRGRQRLRARTEVDREVLAKLWRSA